MGGFGQTKKFTLTAFGRKIFEVEMGSEPNHGAGPERRQGRPAPKYSYEDAPQIELNLISPILGPVIANLRQTNPSLVGAVDETFIETDRDINLAEACRLLREQHKLTVDQVVNFTFRVGAQANLYQVDNVQLAGGIRNSIRSIVDLNWIPQTA